MRNRTALLLIDAQVNMFDPANPVAGADVLMERLKDLLVRARSAHARVIFIRNCGGPNDPDARGTSGWRLHPALEPAAGDLVLDKTTCNTFESTSLAEELKSRGIKRLVIAGLQSDYCIRETALGGIGLGFDVTLVSDGHSTYGAEGKTAEEITDAVNAELGGLVKLEGALETSLA